MLWRLWGWSNPNTSSMTWYRPSLELLRLGVGTDNQRSSNGLKIHTVLSDENIDETLKIRWDSWPLDYHNK